MLGSGSQDQAAIVGLVLVCVGVFALLYVWTAMGLAKLFAKLGDASGVAWVPVLNIVTLLRLGEVNPLTVLFLPIPVVQVIGIVYLVTAINTINRRFGLGAGMTLLGLASLPIWASVLGFGRRVPIGGVGNQWRESDRTVVDLPAPAVGPLWAPYVAVDEPVQLAPVATTAPVIITPTAEPVVVPVAEPMATAATSEAEVTLSEPTKGGIAWAPPPLMAPSQKPRLDPVITTAPVVAASTQGLGDVDKTVVGRRTRAPGWLLTAEGSRPVKLTGKSALIGRNPASSDEYPRAQLVTLADPDKTVSKTHAHLSLFDGRWSITDLSSTNGVYLVTDTGDELEIEIGQPIEATESFRLGDLTVTLTAEGSTSD